MRSDSLSDPLVLTDHLFFGTERSRLDKDQTQRLTTATLNGIEDGELFLEYRNHESILLENGIIKSANAGTSSGFGLRAIMGEKSSFAHSDDISDASLKRAAQTISQMRQGNKQGQPVIGPSIANRRLYSPHDPLCEMNFADRVTLLCEIDSYIREHDSHVVQVNVSFSSQWQAVQIIRPNENRYADLRPLVHLSISVVVERNGLREGGMYGYGGRFSVKKLAEKSAWQHAANEAVRQALVKLDAIPTPAGEMDVVLGSGWPGILLHEAVGHGLEGDFNRKGTSAFTGCLGKRVAARGVTVVDDGTLPDRRGSLSFDDEGTPSQRTILIEDGILLGYMQDRHNARLMKMQSTGNGRRQSYAYRPLPRMTNTLMMPGKSSVENIIHSTKKGLYAVNFSGGQVDITSGKFVFSTSEAYLIENGKITAPVKGATLIGNGPDAMHRITMIGNDFSLDPGIGTCGKQGQGVPVGVGQPTIKLNGLTVGGTQT